MTASRDQIIQTLWHGVDPFKDFDRSWPTDKQGWGSLHRYLSEAVAEVKPKVVVEIGVWKGGSVMTLAKALRDNGIDGVVIAIDTWLGSAEHWISSTRYRQLSPRAGRMCIQNTFMTNICDEKLEEFVVPFPIDSINASVVLQHYGIKADVLHIDAGHEYESVSNDLKSWWPLLNSGGILIGDDYHLRGEWPGVKQAFDELAAHHGIKLESHPNKCLIRKP